MENGVYVGIKAQDLFIRTVGRVTAEFAYPLQKYLLERLSSIPPDTRFHLDLAEADYVDSTFLGLIVRTDRELQATRSERLEVLNPGPAVEAVFKTMGLSKLLKFGRAELPAQVDFVPIGDGANLDQLERARMVLSAHRALMDLSDENRARFELLSAILERQIEDVQGR